MHDVSIQQGSILSDGVFCPQSGYFSFWLFKDSTDNKVQDSAHLSSKQMQCMSACQVEKYVKAFRRSKQHDSHQSQWGTSSWNLTKCFQIALHLQFPNHTETSSWYILFRVSLLSSHCKWKEAQRNYRLRLAARSSVFNLKARWHLDALPCNPISYNRADRLRARVQFGFLFGYSDKSQGFSNLTLNEFFLRSNRGIK